MAAHGSAMPTLFHQMFMATGEPNRYDIPAFFALHLWLWKHNPSGLFAPFNPRVSCDPGSGLHRHQGDDASRPSSDQATYACSMPSGVHVDQPVDLTDRRPHPSRGSRIGPSRRPCGSARRRAPHPGAG